MIIRIFEYATQVALDAATLKNNKLTVTIPHASIIFLRSNNNTPDEMIIEMITPGGNVSFTVPVLKVKTYSLSDIFEKELYFLLPFYIFNVEKDFPLYDTDEAKLETLKTEYNKFIAGIDEAVSEGKISVYYRRVILDMSKKVLENIARKYENVQQGVNEIMGGRVLEHEGKKIFNEGVAVGEARGEARGRYEANFETARRLRQMGMSDKDIQQATNLSFDDIRVL